MSKKNISTTPEMYDANHSDCSTQVNLLVCDNKRVWLQKTNNGLGLLGGYIPFQFGIVEGLKKAVIDSYQIYPQELSFNGIYQFTQPRTNKWTTSIVLCSKPSQVTDESGLENIISMPINEAISLNLAEFATPQVKQSIIYQFAREESISIPSHAFQVVAYDPYTAQGLNINGGKQHESTVVSAIIQDNLNRVLLVKIPHENSFVYSLPGGKVSPNELLLDGLARELNDKLDAQISPQGIFSVYVTAIGKHEYITNFCYFTRVKDAQEIFPIPSDQSAKNVYGREWISPDDLIRERKKVRKMRADALDLFRDLHPQLDSLASTPMGPFMDLQLTMANLEKMPAHRAKTLRKYLLPIDVYQV